MQRFAPSLDKGPLPLRHFRDGDRRSLLELLDSVRGRKALVIEDDFAGPLGLVAEALTLKEHGVEMFCVLELAPSTAAALAEKGVRHVVYALRPRLAALQTAVAHVRMLQAASARSAAPARGGGAPPGGLEFSFFLMPEAGRLAPRLLAEAGLAGDVALRDWPLAWVALDEDLLSLEMPGAFKELAVDGDESCLYDVARALTALQAANGTVRHLKGMGPAAAGVRRIMARMRREAGVDAPGPAGPGGVDTLILLDRTVDMVSPMATQLTYEGLLDETYGLSAGRLRLGADGDAAEPGPGSAAGAAAGAAPLGAKTVYGLNSGDAVFRETRDRIYLGARRWLNDTLRTIQQFRDTGMHSADIAALRGFVAELREKFVRLPLHTELVDRLAGALGRPGFAARQAVEAGLLDEGDEMPAIEELMYQGEPLLGVLRLLVLYCAVHGGVPRRHYDNLRRDLLNTYGHQHLLTLGALQRAGLLRRREGRRSGFGAAKAALNLLLQPGETIDEANPQDIHFAYAGYAPLSVRIVQAALGAGGWGAVDTTLSQLPGPTFEVGQGTDAAGLPVEWREGRGAPAPPPGVNAAAASPPAAGDGGEGAPKRTIMVMFIGGVTCAEVSALRWLATRPELNCNILVGTTKVVTGATLLQPLVATAGGGGGGGGAA